ncbi:FxsA family protein [Paenibacillus sp. 1001270B_150601_E10]|uniref:FxsA family protein n=1 Tax=Paenibacillus sp. 1001270B_150601_E10 TaxID=2787079 RepID=UPI00189DFA6A
MKMIWILLLLTIVPAIEIYGFILMSDWIGGWNTLFFVILSSLIGLIIVRHETTQVVRDAQSQMQSGQVPGRAFIDGICIFAGGVLLLSPGFFTDIVGFTLVFPLTRPVYRHFILKWIEKKMKDGKIITFRRF